MTANRICLQSLFTAVAASVLIGQPSLATADIPGRFDSATREQLVETLRKGLREEAGWVRIHAAEALIWQGYGDEVLTAFEDEVNTQEPQYRIGVWRVLASATRDPAIRKEMTDRIRIAFADVDGPDRIHAAESLAKLGYKITAEERSLFKAAASAKNPADGVFAHWVLAISGSAVARNDLVSLLKVDDPIARLRAAYALRTLASELTIVQAEAIQRAAVKEPADSVAKPFLLGAAWTTAKESGDSHRFKTEVEKLTRHSEVGTRYQAALLLGELGTIADIPLLKSLSVDPEADVRIAAANALMRIDRRVPHRMAFGDWVVIGGYLIGMLLVGWYYARKVTTTDDYMLGGRNMKSWAVGISLFAALISTISTLTWPGEVIMHGPMILSGLLAYPFVALVVGWFLIPFFMKLKVTSAYEILEVRLGLGVRMLGSSLFLSLRLLWMAVILYATTTRVIIPITGLDPSMAPWICAVMGFVTIIYTSQGGLRAVVATEVVQSGILFFGALLTMIVVTWELGGFSTWWPTEWPSHWQEPRFGYDPTVRVTLMGAFIATFTWFICTAGSDQMAIQRYLATRDVSAARKMFSISLISSATVELFLGILGFALLAYFQTYKHLLADGQSVATHADQLFPQFIVVGLPEGICGLMIAGLVAAAMDSLSSGVNSTCSVVTVDFLDRFRKNKESERNHVRIARIVSVLIGIVVVALSALVSLVRGNLLEIAYKVVNLFVAPLFGLFFMAMFVPRATAFGTIIGAIAGLATTISINYWREIFGTQGISFLWAMPLSLLIQIAVGTAISQLPIGQRREAPEKVLLQESV